MKFPDLQVSYLSSKRRRAMQPDSAKIWDPRINHDPSERNNLLKINVYLFI